MQRSTLLACSERQVAFTQRTLGLGMVASTGTYAVQLARELGARITAVCSTANLALVESLGASEVINYTKQDFTKQGHVYDVVFDAVGKSSASRCKLALKTGGRFVSVNGSAQLEADDLDQLKQLAEAGKPPPSTRASRPTSTSSSGWRSALAAITIREIGGWCSIRRASRSSITRSHGRGRSWRPLASTCSIFCCGACGCSIGSFCRHGASGGRSRGSARGGAGRRGRVPEARR